MNQRMKRVNGLLTQELSKILQEEFAEKYGIITIGYLYTDPDLKNAEIGITVFDKSKEKIIVEKINQQSWNLRNIIGDKVSLKNMPKLNFVIDRGIEKITKIDKLLDQINRK